MLFGLEAKHGLTIAMAVPGKGNVQPWISTRVAQWLDDLRQGTVIVTADKERPIRALMDEVRRKQQGNGAKLLEHALVGEKQCNQYGEGAVNIYFTPLFSQARYSQKKAGVVGARGLVS